LKTLNIIYLKNIKRKRNIMYNINILSNQIKNAEYRLKLYQWKYFINGNIENLIKEKKKTLINFNNERILIFVKEKKENEVNKINKIRYDYIYRFLLNYNGNIEKIIELENLSDYLIKNRKILDKKILEKKYKELILLRNAFARSIGFNNYLEYKYFVFGINNSDVDNNIKFFSNNYIKNINYLSYKECVEKLKKYTENILKKNKQLNYILKFLDKINFRLKNIKLNIKQSEHKKSAGSTIDLSIPKKILLNINLNDGIGYFLIFMHEIGHALYFSNIRQKYYEIKKTLNSIFDEGIALFFEKITVSKDFMTNILELDYISCDEIFYLKNNLLLTCVLFENDIYSERLNDNLDEVWGKYASKYYVNELSHWSKEHFFFSEPGYHYPYLLGSFLADSLSTYFKKNNISLISKEMGQFLNNKIFKKGSLLNQNDFFNEILFLR